MRRRRFLTGAACGLAGLTLGAGRALAQPPGGRRPDWSPNGPLDGREPADAHAMTPEERAHVPVLVMPRQPRIDRPFDLVVQIGDPVHPMAEHHHIDWIEVAVGEERVLVADLTETDAFPIVRVPIVLRAPSVLTARAHCNRHGVWRTRREVRAR